MSGYVLGPVWEAVYIDTPMGPKVIDAFEKLVLIRFADCANAEGVASYVSWKVLVEQCGLSRREIARLMKRLSGCPKSPKYRTEECGDPGERCLHHWGVLGTVGLYTTKGVRCRRYFLRLNRLLDKNLSPRRCQSGTFEGGSQAPLKVHDGHPIPPIQDIHYVPPDNSSHFGNSVSSSSSSQSDEKKGRRRIEIPEDLARETLGKQLNEAGEAYTPASLARLVGEVFRRDPGATGSEIIAKIQYCMGVAQRTGVRKSLIGFLFVAVPAEFGDAVGDNGKARRPRRVHNTAESLVIGCVCGHRGRCDWCKARNLELEEQVERQRAALMESRRERRADEGGKH